MPGQELFQHLDEQGNRRAVDSTDMNTYLNEVAGQEFGAKDCRSWSGTVIAAAALREFEKFDSQTQAKKNVVAAIESVAKKLGNTKTICRQCHAHPVVVDSIHALNSTIKHAAFAGSPHIQPYETLRLRRERPTWRSTEQGESDEMWPVSIARIPLAD
ncbi:MAG: hypothetical protein U0744_00270 [Gemmataceae bacterium]